MRYRVGWQAEIEVRMQTQDRCGCFVMRGWGKLGAQKTPN